MLRTRTHTEYTFEHYDRTDDTEHVFPLPFDPESEPEHIMITPNGLKAVLAFLVPDIDAADPFEEFDEGDFYQFDYSYIHYTARPDYDEFKRIVRANPGRVFTHNGTGNWHGPGTTKCYPVAGPFGVRDTRFDSKGNRAGDSGRSITDDAIDDADGYYIVPEDATDKGEYAVAQLEQYSNYCNGEVYGICVWTYRRASIADPWPEPERDDECWGYYGRDGYTLEELKSTFDAAASCFYHD